MSLSGKILQSFWNVIGKMDAKRISKKPPYQNLENFCDITYKEGSFDKYHTLDVYYPSGTCSPLPVIVDIHGGSWMYGQKDINKHYAMYLATRGFVVVNISYRLVPSVQIDGQIQDIFDVLAFMEQNSSQYYMDLDNTFLVGDSAGGHLAMLAAVVNTSDELCQKFGVKRSSIDIKGLGLSCSVYDIDFLYRLKHIPLAKEMLKSLLGNDYENSSFKQDLSFKYGIKNHKLPPVFMISCQQDFMYKQNKAFKELLEENNIEHKALFFGKYKDVRLRHVFNIIFPEYKQSIEANDQMCQYFKSFITD